MRARGSDFSRFGAYVPHEWPKEEVILLRFLFHDYFHLVWETSMFTSENKNANKQKKHDKR